MEGYAVDSGVQETKRRLKRAGFKGDDLEAMTGVLAGMEERLATKEDLAEVRNELKQDIADVRTELREDLRERFEGFRQEIGGKMDGLKGQIDGLRWMMGVMLAMTVPTLATLIALALR